MSKNRFFTLERSQIIKGIAIILMIMTHLFNDYWIQPENRRIHWYIMGVDIEQQIAYAAGICVGLYAFCSGYAFWENKKFQNAQYRLKKIVIFLLNYWIAYGVLILIGLAFSNNGLPTLPDFLSTLFGIISGPGIVPQFAWYVSFYIEILVVAPILIKFASRKEWSMCFLVIIIGCRAMCFFISHTGLSSIPTLEGFFQNLPTVYIGIFFAKYSVFERLYILMENIKGKNVTKIVISVFIITVCYGIQIIFPYIKGFKMEAYLAPVIIFYILYLRDLIPNLRLFDKFLFLLCGYSTNLWYLHCIPFWGGFIQKLFYWPRLGGLILLWSILLLLPLAMLTKFIQKKVPIK